MGKSIAKVDGVVQPKDIEKAFDKDDNGNSSDSEYSSLEDNDDDSTILGKCGWVKN